MLTLKVITENTQEVIDRLAKKHYDAQAIIAEVLTTDKTRKSAQQSLDNNLAKINQLSKSIGQLMKEGQKEAAEAARQEVSALKEASKQLEIDMKEAEKQLTGLLCQIPNLPSDRVPAGKQAEDNVVEKSGGIIPALYEGALPHWELAKKYDLIDFELGVKIAGAGFPVYKKQGAQLQRALINFFLDKAREAGYEEVQPPYVVNADSGYGTGQLPDKEGQMYH
ncbi:MAG: serine--tRNA ligase, partial [Dysgonamonadaceae bacterium]|nr:serine--tRNA ligase [Dysgonamonadaceae bacterium]